MSLKLLSTGNPKILKGIEQGYNTYILHLAPYTLSGKNVCSKATAGCIASCLNKAGRGGMFKKGENTNVIQKARIRKTELFFSDRTLFMSMLVADIKLAIKQSARLNLIPVFRLNGTSDLSWEKYEVTVDGVTHANIFAAFPTITFYDYTAVLGRRVKDIKNYHLTFSRKESNEVDSRLAANQGLNVAVVFSTKKGQPFPETFYGRPTYNGDESDLRFLDPKGHIVALYAKGPAKKDTSGFVVRV